MKILQTTTCILLFIWLMGSPLATAQSSSTPDVNRKALKSLLEELKVKIDDADKRMVAHPRFIEELRALVDRYRAKLREVFFYEDFSDGNYTKNPTWTVRAGQFKITSANRLWSRITTTSQSQTTRSDEEPLERILRELIKSAKKSKQDESKSPAKAQTQAIIQSLTRIAPAFEIDLTFFSKSTWGAMEVVLLGGSPRVSRYRLIYKAAPSRQRPIEIARVRGSRSYVIESATKYPSLDDGAPHRLQWIRDTRGNMRVLVDGNEVLSTVELYYRSEFSGVALVNDGGTYEWGSIKILQAEEATRP